MKYYVVSFIAVLVFGATGIAVYSTAQKEPAGSEPVASLSRASANSQESDKISVPAEAAEVTKQEIEADTQAVKAQEPSAPPAPAANKAPESKPSLQPKTVAEAPKPTPVQTAQPKVEQPVSPAPSSCESGSFSEQFLCFINQHRQESGKSPLRYDATLNAVARGHSAWMSANDTMSHTGENGSTFPERCQAVGITCNAENVAMGYITAAALFQAWKESPGHNTNMLGSYTTMGLALEGRYATNIFKR